METPGRRIRIYAADVAEWSGTLDRMLDNVSTDRNADRDAGTLPNVSDERLRKSKRFVRREDGYRSLLAEMLTLDALRRESGLPVTADDIGRDEKGKPHLRTREDVHFNVSHSGGFVICAVDSSPIGVDIEAIRDIDLDIAETCFTETERRRLYDAGPGGLEEFYRLWTLKESYLKALGTGLSRNPLTVEIRPDDERKAVWIAVGEDAYELRTVTIAEGYRAALCAAPGFELAERVWKLGQ